MSNCSTSHLPLRSCGDFQSLSSGLLQLNLCLDLQLGSGFSFTFRVHLLVSFLSGFLLLVFSLSSLAVGLDLALGVAHLWAGARGHLTSEMCPAAPIQCHLTLLLPDLNVWGGLTQSCTSSFHPPLAIMPVQPRLPCCGRHHPPARLQSFRPGSSRLHSCQTPLLRPSRSKPAQGLPA